MADDALPLLPGSSEPSRDSALFARWRAANPMTAPAEDLSRQDAVDAMTLAAYLDGAAAPDERASVEAALLRDPALLDFLIERQARPLAAEAASPALLASAQALISESPESDSAEVLDFRRYVSWRRFVPMGAMAASVALVALAGFNIGLHAQEHLAPTPTATSPDMFDPQTLLQDNELG